MLGCISAAASYGIAVPGGSDGRVHVSVPPDLSRMRHSADARQHVHAGVDRSVRLHREQRCEGSAGWRVSPADAIAQTAACTCCPLAHRRGGFGAEQPRRSVRHGPLLPPLLRAALPEHLRIAIDRSDAAAESSGETFVRLEVEDRRIPIWSRAWLTERYRADHLVDEWLPVESDGVERHAGQAVEQDRRRDAVLGYPGTHPMRFTQRMAVEETAFLGEVIGRTWLRGR